MTGRLRDALSRRAVQAILVIAVLALVSAFAVSRLPRTIAAVATLEECSFGSPVLTFEKDAWEAAAPDDERGYSEYQVPVMAWPTGTHFDHDTDALLDAEGATVFAIGDVVQVSGSIVDMRNADIPPCFAAFGIRLEAIAAP